MKRNPWNWLGVTGLLALALLNACGGSDEGGPPDPNNDPVNHDEFTINGAPLGNHTQDISLLALADNQFVALWNNSDCGGGGCHSEAYEQRIDAKGRKASFEIRHGSLLYGNYGAGPVGAALPGGGWASIWIDFGPTQDRASVTGQRFDRFERALGSRVPPRDRAFVTGQHFDSQGAPVGAPISIPAGGDNGGAVVPNLGSGPSGELVAAWSADGVVRAQRLASDGSMVGSKISVGGNASLKVVVGENGAFAVAWLSYGGGSGRLRLGVQRFAASGAPQGGSILINAAPAPDATLEAAPGGWIYAGGSVVQRHTADGTKLGADLPLPNAQYPVIGVGQDGKFVVAWGQRVDSSTFNIQAQRFAADGSKIGDVIQLNSGPMYDYFGSPSVAAVAVAPNGRFLITWIKHNADRTPGTLQGRLFEP